MGHFDDSVTFRLTMLRLTNIVCAYTLLTGTCGLTPHNRASGLLYTPAHDTEMDVEYPPDTQVSETFPVCRDAFKIHCKKGTMIGVLYLYGNASLSTLTGVERVWTINTVFIQQGAGSSCPKPFLTGPGSQLHRDLALSRPAFDGTRECNTPGGIRIGTLNSEG